jgi:hypothetical protein
MFAGQLMVGSGLTVTVAVIGVPAQPLAVGVIVNVVVTGSVVVFVNDPDMLPEPLAAIPVVVAVFVRVQAYVVPATGLDNTIVVIAVPEHIV